MSKIIVKNSNLNLLIKIQRNKIYADLNAREEIMKMRKFSALFLKWGCFSELKHLFFQQKLNIKVEIG